MKDIKGNEIKSGDKVHIFGVSQKDNESLDVNAIVVSIRGRGIKFIDEVTSKEYTQEYIKEHCYKINVLEPRVIPSSTGEKTKVKSNSNVVPDELILIEKLKDYGWYGTIHKKANDTKFTVTLPEYEN